MSPRIEALDDDRVPEAARSVLEATRKSIGRVPNLHRTLAHSPAALTAYARTAEALGGGVLSAALRERIALATAGVNGCEYCASAHTAIGSAVGLDRDELERNLHGRSADAQAAAALRFVRELIETRGAVSDTQLAAVRAAGFSEPEIVEIVAHVAMNTFTNLFNRLAGTTIDFPVVDLGDVA